MTPAQKKIEYAIEAVEDRATGLLYWAEQFSLTGGTIYDLKVRRQGVLSAAREYATAIRRLARLAP